MWAEWKPAEGWASGSSKDGQNCPMKKEVVEGQRVLKQRKEGEELQHWRMETSPKPTTELEQRCLFELLNTLFQTAPEEEFCIFSSLSVLSDTDE